jgi:hypothetical protein
MRVARRFREDAVMDSEQSEFEASTAEFRTKEVCEGSVTTVSVGTGCNR